MRQGDYFQTSLFFKISEYEVKANGLQYISIALNLAYNKIKL